MCLIRGHMAQQCLPTPHLRPTCKEPVLQHLIDTSSCPPHLPGCCLP